MKISVVVLYNGEDYYINDCLKSLSEQTYKDFEVVLVETGGHTCDVVTDYSLPSYKRIKSDADTVGAARNAGIEAAEGEYITFLDCDDYLETDALDTLIIHTPADAIFGEIAFTWYGLKFYDDSKAETEDDTEGEGDESEEPDADDSYSVDDRVRRLITYKKKNFQNVTVLGTLYRKDFIDGKGIRFGDEKYFGDLLFLTQVISHASAISFEEEKKLYVKRKHNDPINHPSLLQKKDNHKIVESSEVIKRCIEIMYASGTGGFSDAYIYLRAIVDKYIKYTYVSSLSALDEMTECGTKQISQADTYYEAITDAAKHINDNFRDLKNLDKKNIRLIKRLVSSDMRQVLKRKSRANRLKTLKKILKSRAALKKYLYRAVFAKQPMWDDVIIYESFFGKNYSDSPRYIYEYLRDNRPGKYRHVWVWAGKKLALPSDVKQIKRFSLTYFKYMARAKYHVFNGRQPAYFIKRKGNIFLETWHGTPLKKLVFDMDEVTGATPLYKQIFYKQKNCWDYLIAPNEFCDGLFRRAFMYDGNMLRTGYPRNDILYLSDKDKDERVGQIRDEIGLPKDKKIILYAPTWRDDEYYAKAQYKFTLQLRLDEMREALSDEYVVILRMHYFIADNLDLSDYEGFAYDVSKYDDIARLYLISDILITDYSSVFFDYANLKRPMLFYTYDLEKYEGVLRGFYIDVKKELPGPMLSTTKEVIDAINDIDGISDEYKDKYDLFYEKFCGWEDGTASKKVVDEVFS